MANYGRIKQFWVEESTASWKVTIDVSPPAEAVDFKVLICNAYPTAFFSSTSTEIEGFEVVHRTSITIPKSETTEQDLGRFLRILQWTVTIADVADESHAIYLHDLPHPRKDSDEPNWQPTRIGIMVRKAKSYSPRTGSKPAAKELADKFRFWLKRHPRYGAVDVVISVPPGNKEKAFDLPEFVAHQIAEDFSWEEFSCAKVGEMVPQKDLKGDLEALQANINGKFAISADLSAKEVLLIDDIYGSGTTINELTRACKAAGAVTVLSLTATKTARHCNGFTPGDWYQVSMEAANLPVDDKDD